MKPDEDLAARINRASYLFMRSIQEPIDNQLSLIIEEAAENEEKRGQITRPSDSPEIQALLKDTAPIESIDGCLTYRLFWPKYVAYLVTEQLVGSCGSYDDESHQGRLFRLYSKSHFLDHLTHDTGAYSHPLLHFKIACLNHLVDVASEMPPAIEIIPRSGARSIQ